MSFESSINNVLTNIAITLAIFGAIIIAIGYLIKIGYPLLRSLNKSNLKLSISNAKGIIFGKLWKFRVYSPVENEGHCIVFGGSGEGKTTALLIPTLRSWNGTSFVIDISGDIGTNVHDTNKLVFEPDNDDTIPYNIFGAIDDLDSIEDKNEALLELASLILPPLNENANDASKFFNDYGRKFIEAALLAFYPQGKDFVEICQIITTTDYLHFFDLIEETHNRDALMRISCMFGGNEKNNSGAKSEADDAVIFFATNPKAIKSLRRPKPNEIAITPSVLEKQSVYIVVEYHKLYQYSSLMQIIVGQNLKYFSMRKNYTKPSILFCLDEFAALGLLPILDSVRILRKKSIRIFILTQSLSDIDLIYGINERKVILDNMKFKILLSASEVETQQYFADLIGPRHIRKSFDNLFNNTNNLAFYAEPAVQPTTLGSLTKHLYLIHKGGFTKLRRNYFFKK